jgi:hypothetical protein
LKTYLASRLVAIASDIIRIDAALRDKDQSAAELALRDVLDHCAFMGLKSTRHQANRCLSDLREKLTTDEWGDRLVELERRFHEDTEDLHLLFIEQSKFDIYEDEKPFGDLVDKNFPTARDDISEAAKCYATGRNRASVLHLMRVMEFGLQLLHKRLKLPYPSNPNWHALLESIDEKITANDAAHPRPASWAKVRVFYMESARHFRFFKDARNAAVHVEFSAKNYVAPNEETAERIFGEVKHFMQHLATKSKERKK